MNVRLIVANIIGAVVAGFIFAWLMGYSAKSLIKKIHIGINDDETLIKEGGANHRKGKEAVGGKLVLTNKRLIFKSHKFNIQDDQESFELEEIMDVQTAKTLRFLDNILEFQLSDHHTHKFIVEDSADWVKKISRQKQQDIQSLQS